MEQCRLYVRQKSRVLKFLVYATLERVLNILSWYPELIPSKKLSILYQYKCPQPLRNPPIIGQSRHFVLPAKFTLAAHVLNKGVGF